MLLADPATAAPATSAVQPPSIPFLPDPGTAGVPAWVWQVLAAIASLYVLLSVFAAAAPASWRATQIAKRVAADIRALFGRGGGGDPPAGGATPSGSSNASSASSANGAAPSSGEMHFSTAYRVPAPGKRPPREPGRGLAHLCALTAIAIVSLVGCAAHFEEARLAGLPPPAAAPSTLVRDDARCRELDDSRAIWSGIAKTSAALAGASGLTSIPVKNDDARLGLQAGAVVTGAVAVGAVVIEEARGSAWARECTAP